MKSVKTILKEIEKEEKNASVYGGQSTINLAWWVPRLRNALAASMTYLELNKDKIHGYEADIKYIRELLSDTEEQTK